jgi:hypothetical protein
MTPVLPIPQNLIPVGQEELWRVVNDRLRQTMAGEGGNTSTSGVTASSDKWAYVGTHAQRLSIGPYNVKAGALFYETDRTALYMAITSGSARIWKVIAGHMIGTLSPDTKPTDLGINDKGFIFEEETTFHHKYKWTGSAWTWADRGDPSKRVSLFLSDPGAGWKLMDGTGNPVSYATPTGGISTISLPDSNDDVFPKFGSYTGSVDAAVPGTLGGVLGDAGSGSGVSVTTLSASTGAPSGSTSVQSGGGATVPSMAHSHGVSGTGSGTVTTDHTHDTSGLTVSASLPASLALAPYFRI